MEGLDFETDVPVICNLGRIFENGEYKYKISQT